MAEFLTEASIITCPHGAIADLKPSNKRLSINGKKLLLASDMSSTKPDTPCQSRPPCTTLVWSRGCESVKHNKVALLTSKSEGMWIPSGLKPRIAAGQKVLFNG